MEGRGCRYASEVNAPAIQVFRIEEDTRVTHSWNFWLELWFDTLLFRV